MAASLEAKRHPDPFRFMCWVSFALHIILIVMAVTVPGRVRDTSPPIIVTMMSLPGTGGPAKGKSTAKPKAEPRPEPPAPPAEPAKPELTYPEKTVKSRKTEPAKKSAPAPAAPRPAAGKLESTFDSGEFTTGVGMPGAGGEGSLAGFPFAFYLMRVRDKVSSNWFQSLVIGQVSGQYRVTVYFTILRNGQVTNVQVEESSGISSLDLSAQRAVYASNPMPPLPQGYAEDSLNVHFRFHYEK